MVNMPPLKSGVETWVNSAKPNLNRNSDIKLVIQTTLSYGFLSSKPVIPAGATITSATYDVYSKGASTGSRVASLHMADGPWKPGKLVWTNKPGVLSSPAAATASIGTLADGDQIRFNMLAHLQSWQSGAKPNYGWRLSTNTGNALKVYGYDSSHPPTLTITYTIGPAVPTDLVPSYGAVSFNKPVLSWGNAGGSGVGTMTVQISATQNGASPDFATTFSTVAPQLDLAGTSFAGLTNHATTYWRVGNSAGFSDWVPLIYESQGTLTSSLGASVTDATPDIPWSLSGATQKAWQIILVQVDRPDVIRYDSGITPGTATAATLPPGALYDETVDYKVTIRTWDDKTREAIPGRPDYLEITKTFDVADGTTGAPTGLTATQVDPEPAVVLQWTMSSVDTFTVVRDNKVIATLQDPSDFLVSGTTYRWKDWTAIPRRQHTYAIRAVASGSHSAKSASAVATSEPEGVWLVDATDPLNVVWICCSGTDGIDSWSREDTYGTYLPLNSDRPVKITTNQGGLTSGYGGYFWDPHDGSGRTVAEQITNLNLLCEYPDRVLRMVAGDINIPVIVANLYAGTYSDLQPGDFDRCRVAWQFWQYGELGFTSRL